LEAALEPLFAETVRTIFEEVDPYTLAIIEYNQGTDEGTERALQIASRLIGVSSLDRPYAHTLLGIIHRDQGSNELAYWHFDQAVQSDRAFGLAHHNWANALSAQGRLSSALDHFEAAVKVGVPSYILPWTLAFAGEVRIKLAAGTTPLNHQELIRAAATLIEAIKVAYEYHDRNPGLATPHGAIDHAHTHIAYVLEETGAPEKNEAVAVKAEFHHARAALANPTEPTRYHAWGRFLLNKKNEPILAEYALARAVYLYEEGISRAKEPGEKCDQYKRALSLLAVARNTIWNGFALGHPCAVVPN
jgi:tetratricopeptide (TPR) repeat protein